ncbi:DUF1491 family protein [Croceicoccus sp. F390]|uniref:DUF1491 family protein n=1 Tax=Croceicoccus esteveae TaxID=3075597 RepID=A0ABU2ZJK9_9SPHN|nr:DUF1491 family protein [Croceicoccus sp. F390]MDT0576213.1 DUF1491 family protein [Croceicoccus sp. F390]
MNDRLPAHVEVSGLIRAVNAAGGFATVLKSGERDCGTILTVARQSNDISCLYERLPTVDGTRRWTLAKQQDIENKQDFLDYLARRGSQDADCWIVELDIACAERFIGILPAQT